MTFQNDAFLNMGDAELDLINSPMVPAHFTKSQIDKKKLEEAK